MPWKELHIPPAPNQHLLQESKRSGISFFVRIHAAHVFAPENMTENYI